MASPRDQVRDSGIGGDRPEQEEAGQEADDSILVVESENEDSPPPPDQEGQEDPEDQPDDHDDDNMPPQLDPNAQGNAVKGGQLNNLSNFDGCPSTDIEGWLSTVDRALLQFGWSQVSATAAAKSKLVGVAGKWLRAQEIRNIILDNWNSNAADDELTSLRRALVARFAIQDNVLMATDAVANLKQTSRETVSEFFDRVVVCIDKKNYNYTTQEKTGADYLNNIEKDIYTFFGAGLLEIYRQGTLGGVNPPKTSNTLLTAAVAVEREHKRNQKHAEVHAVGAVKAPVTSETDGKQMSAILSQLKRLNAGGRGGGNSPRGGGQGAQAQGGSTDFKCFNCQGYGHYIDRCSSSPRGGPRGRGRGRGKGRGKGRTGNQSQLQQEQLAEEPEDHLYQWQEVGANGSGNE